jgi:hypothetical protein
VGGLKIRFFGIFWQGYSEGLQDTGIVLKSCPILGRFAFVEEIYISEVNTDPLSGSWKDHVDTPAQGLSQDMTHSSGDYY